MDAEINQKDEIEEEFQKDLGGILKEDDDIEAEKKLLSDSEQEFDNDDSFNSDGEDEKLDVKEAIDELSETISDINDRVTGIYNDQKSFIDSTQQRFEDIDNTICSLIASLHEITDLSQSLADINSNISINVTNLQGALNQINDSTSKCINELQCAADEIPQKLLDDCNNQNKKALQAAVSNFNAMNIASQKWIKRLGNNSDLATQIVIISGVLTPLLVLISIVYILMKIN